MTLSNDRDGSGFLDVIFAILALLLITGTILVAIGGIYYQFINPAL